MQRPPSGPDSPVFQFMRALVGCDKPVVAAVTGAAIGIGTTMLLHCDLVYVSDEARLAMPFVSLGLVPEFGSSLLLPLLMGTVRAAEKLLLGDPFTAPQDGRGLRHRQRGAAGRPRWCTMRAAWPSASTRCRPSAVRETKRLMRKRAQRRGARRRRRSRARVFASACTAPRRSEAFSAFFQKRKPDFTKF